MNTPDDSDNNNLRYAEYALGVLDADARAAVAQESLVNEQAAAAVALWQVGGVDVGLPVLVETLKDSDVKVREQACKALGELGNSKLVPIVALDGGLRDEAPSVRVLAAEAPAAVFA